VGAQHSDVERFDALLKSLLSPLEVELCSNQVIRLKNHYKLLLRWNSRINLTSVREPDEIAERHFGESLFLAQLLPHEGTVVDIGSGAGFPGFPVSVARPSLLVTLVESVRKKAAFLQELARNEARVKVYAGRFHSVDWKFDWAIWRGVALEGIENDIALCVDRVAAITSERQAAQWKRRKKLMWEQEQVIPWDKRRVVLVGRSIHVPRET